MGPFWNAVANVGQGGAGAILAIIVVFYFQKKNGNGNGQQKYNDDVEYGKLMQKVDSLERTTRGLVDTMGKLQTEVAIASSNVLRLTQQLGKRT